VHLRRALLLFAIVLGLAALVASVSSPRDERKQSTPPPATGDRAPTVTPGAARPNAARVVFPATRRATRRLDAGRPAVVVVEARTAGQAEIPRLGLSAPAERRTPARFDVLTTRPGRYEIRFTPAEGGETILAGTLIVGRAK
jgi:hypothetical protein